MGGPLPSAPEEPTASISHQQTSHTVQTLHSDVVLPYSAPIAPTQPREDDATGAFPVTAGEALSNSSDRGSILSSISTLSFIRDSTSSNRQHYQIFAADAAADVQTERLGNMVATELLLTADPAAAPPAKPHKLSALMGRVFTASSSSGSCSNKGQLLLPCLLGDPFVCLNVNKRVGVSAGTLLGRLSLFYWPTPPSLQQQQQQTQDGGIGGQVLLPQAYSDDGVAICWMDTSYVTAIMGASDLVQWRLPSLRCMGSEQLSLFAGHSAFNSVTISMRLLRRQQDTQQLLLLYRHCSKALAEILLYKIKHPRSEASFASSFPVSGKGKEQQKAWAEALALGVCTLDPQQQQQQQQLLRNHSTCLLGTGAACIMDLREGDMYERYETSYFCKLWRSVEACNLIALDFNGDFVLCCNSDGSMERRWLYVIDARGASRQVEESQGWCVARRSYMDEFIVYKRLAPRRMQHACFFSHFFLLISATNRIVVYDMRVPFFSYYSSRAKALELISWRRAVDAACAAFACCEGTCTNYKGAEQQQHQQQQQGGSASGSGSRLLRRHGAAAASPRGSRQERNNNSNSDSSTTGDKGTGVPLRCLPALFLRCLQRGTAEHERVHAKLNRKSTGFINRIVNGVSPGKADSASFAVGGTKPPEAAGHGENHSAHSDVAAREEEMVHVLQAGEGEGLEEAWHGNRQKYRQDISQAYEDDCHAFFLFEITPLALRVCDAFFRFCSLLLQQQRQQQQRSNICNDDASTNAFLRPPSPCTRKPMKCYRQRSRVLYLDSSRIDFCFLSLDSSGWLRTYSLFRSKVLQSVRLDRGLFAAGWPYSVASDGSVVAYTTDKGVYGLLLNEKNLGCSWVTGAEAFCSMPLDPGIERAAPEQGTNPESRMA